MIEIYTVITTDYTGFVTLASFYSFGGACQWCAEKVWQGWGREDDEQEVKHVVCESLGDTGEYTDESNNHYVIKSGMLYGQAGGCED